MCAFPANFYCRTCYIYKKWCIAAPCRYIPWEWKIKNAIGWKIWEQWKWRKFEFSSLTLLRSSTNKKFGWVDNKKWIQLPTYSAWLFLIDTHTILNVHLVKKYMSLVYTTIRNLHEILINVFRSIEIWNP